METLVALQFPYGRGDGGLARCVVSSPHAGRRRGVALAHLLLSFSSSLDTRLCVCVLLGLLSVLGLPTRAEGAEVRALVTRHVTYFATREVERYER